MNETSDYAFDQTQDFFNAQTNRNNMNYSYLGKKGFNLPFKKNVHG